MMNRLAFVKTLLQLRKDEVVICTMTAARDWQALSDSPLDFPIIGAMGFASSFGLGIALAKPQRRVLVLDGDGSLLMNLGSLVTIADQAPPNLVHFLFENGLYEIAGRIPRPGRGKVRFTDLARGAGFKKVYEYDDLDVLRQDLPLLLTETGPLFVDLKIEPGPRDAVEVAKGLKGTVAMARALEQALQGA